MKILFEQFIKIYETVLFKDESLLKSLLLKNEDFANGDVLDALVSIVHEVWTQDITYNDILLWVEDNLGELPLLAIFLFIYDGQVSNGGHRQYFDNGYASSNSGGFGSNYKDIDKHDEFVKLFRDLDMINKLKLGKEAYSIMSEFELNFFEEEQDCPECNGSGEDTCIYCGGNGNVDCDECGGSGVNDEEESCDNCDGEGTIECGDCNGKGTIRCDGCGGSGTVAGDMTPDVYLWESLDTKWYEINDNLMKEFNDYLKSLTLDGDKISKLISLAK